MDTSIVVIDLTESFSLAKFDSTSNVIDLLDTDDSFNSSFATIATVIENNNSEQVKRPSLKKKHTPKLGADGSSNQGTSKEKKRKSRSWGDCPICWDELGRNQLASTKCGHVYCMKCLEQSLKVEKRCPTCRRVLKGSSSYHPLFIHM